MADNYEYSEYNDKKDVLHAAKLHHKRTKQEKVWERRFWVSVIFVCLFGIIAVWCLCGMQVDWLGGGVIKVSFFGNEWQGHLWWLEDTIAFLRDGWHKLLQALGIG